MYIILIVTRPGVTVTNTSTPTLNEPLTMVPLIYHLINGDTQV